VGGILDQDQPVLVAELLQRAERRRVAAVVHGADRLRARPDPGGDVLRVEPEVLLPDDLGQHGRAPAVADSRRGGDEGDAGDDHLVAGTDPGRQVGEMQRRRAAADRDGVRSPQVRGELGLELLDPRAHGQPAGAQGRGDGLDVGLLEADVEDRDRVGGGVGGWHRHD